MKLHADLTKRAVVNGATLYWIASPAAGVARRMLERDGDEVARATSLVKYDSGSKFPEHTHSAGEEFLVLEGVFSDATGDFGPGSYVRNSIGSKHAPWSNPGAIILVKLRQMVDSSEPLLRVNYLTTQESAWSQLAPGVRELTVYTAQNDPERVRIVHFQKDSSVEIILNSGGEEIFVIDGSIEETENVDGAMQSAVERTKWTWVRRNESAGHRILRTCKKDDGCYIYIKTGHLPSL